MDWLIGLHSDVINESNILNKTIFFPFLSKNTSPALRHKIGLNEILKIAFYTKDYCIRHKLLNPVKQSINQANKQTYNQNRTQTAPEKFLIT